MQWILEIKMIFNFVINKDLDIYIIASLRILYAIIGFAQENLASKAFDLLKQKLQINAKVLRDSKWEMVQVRELVAGDFVLADLKILTGEELKLTNLFYRRMYAFYKKDMRTVILRIYHKVK